MKGKVLKKVHIRTGAGMSFPSLGVVGAGRILDLDGEVQGESNKGITKWFFLTNADGRKQFYWSGAIEILSLDSTEQASFTLKMSERNTKTYDEKCIEFIGDNSTQKYRIGKSTDYNTWKISWGHIDMEIWKIWKLYGKMGEGVKVAVLDAGFRDIDNDLNGRLLVKETLVDSLETLEDPLPNCHGTKSAGIIGAGGHFAKTVFGVAPKCELLAYKVGDGGFFAYYVEEAIKKAITAGAKIISISLAVEESIRLRNIIKECQDLGIIVIASSGNGKSNIGQLPAMAPGCISVGGYNILNGQRVRNEISNYHESLSLLGPSNKILTTSETSATSFHADTSAAAAFMAGVMALIVSVCKNAQEINYNTLMEAFTKKNICSHISPNARGRDLKEGFGVLDPLQLISYYNKL